MKAGEVMRAFAKFYADPVVATACRFVKADANLLRALALLAFTEGAKFAIDQCDALGHNRPPPNSPPTSRPRD